MRRLLSLLLGVAVVLGPAYAAGPATAATYSVWSCKNGQNQPVSAAGWVMQERNSPAGLRSLVANDCASGGGLGVRWTQGGTWNDGGWNSWEYKPAGVSVVDGTVDVSWEFDNSSTADDRASGQFGIYVDGAGMNEQNSGLVVGCGRTHLSCTSPPTPIALGTVGASKFVAFGAGCFVDPGAVRVGAKCVSPANRASIVVSRAKFTMTEDSAPTATDVGGTLFVRGDVSGTRTVTLTGADIGSGVMYAEVRLADTVVVPRSVVDSNGGQCSATKRAAGYELPTPCKTSLPLSYAIDTGAVDDGTRTLEVILTDAAGNERTVVSRSVTVNNTTPVPVASPTPAPVASPTPAPVASPTPAPVASPTPAPLASPSPGPGMPDPLANGTVDTATAHFASTATSTSTSVVLGKSVTLSEQLVDTAGRGIPGATIDVLETPSRGTSRKVASLTTDAKGRLAYTSNPTGPRLVEFAYARQRGSTQYVDRRSVKLRVIAAVTLRAAQASVVRGRPAVFRGTVRAGELPKRGVRLVLETKGRRGWLIGGIVKSNAKGEFRWAHTFSNRGTFSFRARMLGSDGLSVSPGTSALATVRVR